jgi:hypothetical protein
VDEKPNSFNKRSYEEPRLRVYGDIRVFTQNVNMTAGADDGGSGGGGKPKKTA